MMPRHFPTWSVEQIPGGYKVDAPHTLACCNGRVTRTVADMAKVLTIDEARRIIASIGNNRMLRFTRLAAMAAWARALVPMCRGEHELSQAGVMARERAALKAGHAGVRRSFQSNIEEE